METTAARRRPLQTAALLVGATFVLVGIAGFIPGITTHYGDLGWVNDNGAELLGLFGVNIVHNLLHLALGVVGIVAARSVESARFYLLVGGLAYLGLWVYGLAIDRSTRWNFAALNVADNWLHFGLSVAMVALAVVLPRRAAADVDDVDAIAPARAGAETVTGSGARVRAGR